MADLIAKGRIIQTRPGAVPAEKRYLDEMPGVPLQNDWSDIRPAGGKEALGYPTQKPVALLERIIKASSNEGDVVLDPFCGCGTTIHAAQKLNRRWIGIDITHLAIALVERRLNETFPGIAYDVHGVPKDVAGARDLAERDKHQFQMWITGKIGAQPYKRGQKGMDRGIDGYLHFRDADKKPQFAIVSVKGGGIKSGDIRDLKGTMQREKAAIGLFLTLNPPTREMEREAASAGLYESGGMKMPACKS
jgi:site-specific DNA-methyltransferase (adenine-specific)